MRGVDLDFSLGPFSDATQRTSHHTMQYDDPEMAACTDTALADIRFKRNFAPNGDRRPLPRRR
ncbi:uncharacterized protein TrAFT101_006931 [Trichoderma asperellum]|uniref:uncharacterized protein n=1 Tax=Trichoderma asperellum TaxID=101201 RepID=UPI003323C5C8|nr:hypothetical protein TrAFT101_006931 [Trichoderma asperellum]